MNMASTMMKSSESKLSIQKMRKHILQQSMNQSMNMKETNDNRGKQNDVTNFDSLDYVRSSPRYQANTNSHSGPSAPPLNSQPYGLYSPDLQKSATDALNTSKSLVDTPYGRESGISHSILKDASPGFSSITMQIPDLSSLSMMMERDPEISGSGVLFSAFKESLSSYPNAGQVFDLVACYEQLCRDHIQHLLDFLNQVDPTRKRFQRAAKMINFLYQECYTWRLIGSLIKDRLQTESEEMEMEEGETELKNHFSSKLKIIQKLFVAEPSVRYCQLIVDWLEKNAEDKVNDLLNTENIQFSSDSISWEHTLYNLSHSKKLKSVNTVTEMDPDAPIRQKRNLVDLDQVVEIRLLQFIFSYLRAGKLEEAKKICIKYGQSWRAATLDGWRLWHDPNFESVAENGEIELTQGNQYADIWKSCCWKLCEEEGVNQLEKAIYAALSGNLKQLLSVCESWEDCLWAYFKVLVDARVEQELRLVQDPEAEGLLQEYYAEMAALSPEKVFDELDAHQDSLIRTEGQEPFHLFQKYLILNEQEKLLGVIGSNLDGNEASSAHMLRFTTHALIFFQTVGLEIDEALYTRVLQNYIHMLISKKQGEHVATYTARLSPDVQVQVYSKFLEEIENSEEREHYLDLAKAVGLDVEFITKTVVCNIRENNPDGLEMENVITDNDRKKIKAIEWLIFEPSQRVDALIQANTMIRTFLVSRKLDSARELFEKLPKDSIDVIHYYWGKSSSSALPNDYANAVKEYLCIKAYLNAHDAFNAWFEHFNHQAPLKPPKASIKNFKDQITYEEALNEYNGKLQMWKGNLDMHVQNVSDKIYNVLLFPEGWMMDSLDTRCDDDASRSSQMELIRKICIPMLCFILHSMLHSSQKYKECLQLADVIQSEQHKLFSLFAKDDLQKLLSLFRDSSLSLLNQGKDSMGFESILNF